MSLPASILDLSVLIVDDKSNMRRTIKNILRKAGFTLILEAEDGDTALEKIHYSKVDLILLDWNMPRMKGIEVLREIRASEKHREMMVLMVTGEEQQATVAEAIEGTVDYYLTKPFTPERLLDKVRLLWDSRTNPTKLDLYLKKGWNHLEKREYDQALDEFKLALFESANSPRTHHGLGKAYESLEESKKAKAHYQQAVEMAPQFLMALVSLADLHEKQGELDEAADSLRKAIRINPNNLDRRIRLGRVLLLKEERARALEIFSEVVDKAGETDVETVTKIGDALLEAGLGAEAEDFLSRGLSSVPGAVILKNRLGIAFRIQGKYKEAIDNYRSALKESPDDENLLYNLGRAYHDNGQGDQSALVMKQALRINPDFQAAKQFLVKVLKVRPSELPGGIMVS